MVLSGRWKTGQKIMANLNFLKFSLRKTENISPTCIVHLFDIDFHGQTGIMSICIEFGEILDKTFLNCGFNRNLTINRDATLRPLAEHLLRETKSL